jgi:hypothetical protein
VNDASAEIERIVQNVLAELRAAGVAAATGENGQRQNAASPKQAEASPTKSCVIAERVVTLAALEGRLNGASVLTVPRGAVITPAVRDELKTRGIRLEIADAPAKGEAKNFVELLVGIADVPDDVSVLTKATQEHVTGLANVQSMQQVDLAALIGRMAEWMASRPSVAVVLTRRPTAAVCLANRHRGLRAVWANTPKALAEAMNTIAPNVMIYNPAAHSVSAQRAILREFVSAGVRECPEELR